MKIRIRMVSGDAFLFSSEIKTEELIRQWFAVGIPTYTMVYLAELQTWINTRNIESIKEVNIE